MPPSLVGAPRPEFLPNFTPCRVKRIRGRAERAAPRPKLTRGPLAQRALLGKQCPAYASASHNSRARSLLFKFAKAPCQDKIPKASARYIITVGLFSHIKEPFLVFARGKARRCGWKAAGFAWQGLGGGRAECQETQTSCSLCWQRDRDGDSRAGGTQDCPTHAQSLGRKWVWINSMQITGGAQV